MESNYIVAYKNEWKKLKEKNLDKVAEILDVEYLEEKHQIIVVFLYEEYIVDFKLEKIYKKNNGEVPSISACIIILNYLTFSEKLIIPSTKWVSLKELPNGGALFYPAFHKSSIVNLINKFGFNSKDFIISGNKIGCEIGDFGDRSIIFRVLPKISLCFVLWEGDEEIAPNATILFESSIQYILHIETIIGLGMFVCDKLIEM